MAINLSHAPNNNFNNHYFLLKNSYYVLKCVLYLLFCVILTLFLGRPTTELSIEFKIIMQPIFNYQCKIIFTEPASTYIIATCSSVGLLKSDCGPPVEQHWDSHLDSIIRCVGICLFIYELQRYLLISRILKYMHRYILKNLLTPLGRDTSCRLNVTKKELIFNTQTVRNSLYVRRT